MMMQNQYRNLGGTESLWVNHTVRTSFARSERDPVGTDRCHRRHDLDDAGAAADLRQCRQRRDTPLDGRLAVDRQGNMALGYSASKAAMHRTSATTAGWPPIL